MRRLALTTLLLGALCYGALPKALAEPGTPRTISGVVLDGESVALPGAVVTARSADGQSVSTEADATGHFALQVPQAEVTLTVSGQYIAAQPVKLSASAPAQSLELHVRYLLPRVQESMVITATALDPQTDRRNDTVYKNALFNRDDQLLDTLAAGINTGQHEGGGKSLEVRRFGFNLDHGGVNGGLKVLVDDVQQNQATQGHGQGYLGALKTLTPELVDDVDILNGPFSAEYGDFSGLGVVHIRQKESLPNLLTARIQGGSFNSTRGFLAWSPELRNAQGYLAYEGAYTDGPFLNPGRYRRDNVNGNYTRKLSEQQSLGFRFNFGRNDFYSSGQIPLDLVASGQLDRYGYIDPSDGGVVRLGTGSAYYRRDFHSGDTLKLDGFVGRSLFDLYSNFTFYLNDPVHGDGIQQHDSRLQQGLNAQYLHPFRLLGKSSLLTAGSNFHDNQINVGLLHQQGRVVLADVTSALAHVTNAAGYVQESVELIPNRLHADAGLRYDFFRFNVDDRLTPAHSGLQSAGAWQPKFNLTYSPVQRVPLALHLSYGRGISSADARGVVQRPDQPRLSTTDFLQLGTSYNLHRFSVTGDVFLIDRSHEQVYIPDDGSFEFKGPSRSYGWEWKTSAQLTHHLSFTGGLTQVSNAFYRGTFPREYVDSAPHSVGNAGLTLAGWRGTFGSVRYRHISGYRLDGLDPSIHASGLDVVDVSVSKAIRHGIEFNASVDNANDKRYYETQNYLESRSAPDAPVVARIHGTPGYPVGFTVGMTFRIGEK